MDVLSIDFDIIMAPTIEYYNHMVPSRNWEDIQMENPYMHNPKADLSHYNYLLCLLDKVITKETDIYVAYNHKMIIDFLSNVDIVDVINIDHHHDLGYHPEENEKDNCANWAKQLLKSGKTRNYIWAKNVNSQLPVDSIKEELESYNYIIADFNELKDRIMDMKFDKVFLCMSPEWVPPYYQQLFYGILDLLNQKLNCHLEIHEGS